MIEQPIEQPAAPEAPLVQIPVPRVIGWAVGKIGWGGLGLVVVVAQMAGLLDNLLALGGLPPLSLGTATDAQLEPLQTAEPSQVFVSELLYTRAIQEQILRKVARIEANCLERPSDRP